MTLTVKDDLNAIANEEAAKQHGPGVQCWVCSIPEREWIEKARREGRTLPVIAATLVRVGHPKDKATVHRISNHLLNHVR